MALWINWTYSVRKNKRFNFRCLVTDHLRDDVVKTVYNVFLCHVISKRVSVFNSWFFVESFIVFNCHSGMLHLIESTEVPQCKTN